MRNVAICAGCVLVTICVGWSLFSEFSDSREKLRLQGEMIQRQGDELSSARRELLGVYDRLATVEAAAHTAQTTADKAADIGNQQFADMNKNMNENMNDVHRRLAMVEVADKVKDMRANMPGSTAVSPDPAAAGQDQRRALQDDPGDQEGICLDPAHVAVAATDSAYAVSRAFSRFMVEQFPLLAQMTCVQALSSLSFTPKWLTFCAWMAAMSWRGFRSRPTPRRWPS